MKALTLLFLRLTTGLLLILWGSIKVMAPTAAIHVSDKFYHGALSGHALQLPLGIAEIALGALAVVGLLRVVVLPLQAMVLGVGLFAIWKYVFDPFGLYLVSPDAREPLFFPSLVVFGASCALIAFREFDAYAIDRALRRSNTSM